MKLNLKLDARTAKGGLFKKFVEGQNDIELKQGVLNNKSYCMFCSVSPQKDETVKCAKCKASFHGKCLLTSLSPEVISSITANPCVWWFCLDCLVDEKDDDVTPEIQTQCTDSQTDPIIVVTDAEQCEEVCPNNQVCDVIINNDLKTMISNMKNDILRELKTVVETSIEHKLQGRDNNFVGQLNEFKELPNTAPCEDISDIAGNENRVGSVSGGSKPSFSQVVSNVLVLKPTDTENEKSWEDVEKSINKCVSGINVSFCKPKMNSGAVVMGFPNEETKNKVANKISADENLSKQYTTTSPKKMLPKVTITGIHKVLFEDCNKEDREEMKSALIKDILERNIFLKQHMNDKETLEVVMMKDIGTTCTAVLKISPFLRHLIQQRNNKLYISLKVCDVKDRYHYVQCYHCQRLGHVSADCPKKSDESTCMYCSGPHQSGKCQKKSDRRSRRCINCALSHNEAIRREALTHSAADEKCPIIMRECRRLKMNTMEHCIPKN